VTHTLRLRLILSMLALLVPTVVIAGWLLLEVFGNRLLRDLDVALEEEATTVAALLADPASADNVAALVARIADETDLGPGKQVAVLQGERVVAEAPPGAAAAIRRGGDLRIARGVTAPAEGGLTVAIGLPATAALHAYWRLRAILVIGVPLGLLLLVAGVWMLASHALRPLEDAADAIERVGVDDLSLRLPATSGADEIGRIVTALNRMLDRLSSAVAQMQRLTADAGTRAAHADRRAPHRPRSHAGSRAQCAGVSRRPDRRVAGHRASGPPGGGSADAGAPRRACRRGAPPRRSISARSSRSSPTPINRSPSGGACA
jgi:HAMP domain-containing protein